MRLSAFVVCLLSASALVVTSGCSTGEPTLKQLPDAVEVESAKNMSESELEKLLVGEKPVFTTNWVKRNEEAFRKYLSYLKDKPDAKGLEIGSYEGRSAVWFVKNILTDPSARLTCVDIFPGRLTKYFEFNLRVTNSYNKIIRWTGKSQEVLRTLPRGPEYDFIYVDGCHEPACTLTDAVLAFDLLKVGGVMMIDDYNWFLADPDPARVQKPKPAIDAFVTVFDLHLEVLEKKEMWVVRKTSEAY